MDECFDAVKGCKIWYINQYGNNLITLNGIPTLFLFSNSRMTYVLLLVFWYMFSFSLSALSEKCPIEIYKAVCFLRIKIVFTIQRPKLLYLYLIPRVFWNAENQAFFRTIPILEVVQQWIKNQWQRNISLQNKVSIVSILFFITFLNHKISCKLHGYRMSSWGKNKLTSDIWISGSVSALGGFSLTGWAWNVIQWII